MKQLIIIDRLSIDYSCAPKEEYEYLCPRVRYISEQQQFVNQDLTLLLPNKMRILSSIALEVDMYVSPISSAFD